MWEHSPAPWLMIFDLYRRTNNRAGYDELAPRFRRQFNGRMPDWDNYGHELALDDGLEAFPISFPVLGETGVRWKRKVFWRSCCMTAVADRGWAFSLAATVIFCCLLRKLHEGLTAVGARAISAFSWGRAAPTIPTAPKWDTSLDMIDTPNLASSIRFCNMPPPDRVLMGPLPTR